jgi:hypothetical protein
MRAGVLTCIRPSLYASNHAALNLATRELVVLAAEIIRNGAQTAKRPVTRINCLRGHVGSPSVGEPYLS